VAVHVHSPEVAASKPATMCMVVGLARAAGAEESQELTRLDLQDTPSRRRPTEALAELLEADAHADPRLRRGHSSPPQGSSTGGTVADTGPNGRHVRR